MAYFAENPSNDFTFQYEHARKEFDAKWAALRIIANKEYCAKIKKEGEEVRARNTGIREKKNADAAAAEAADNLRRPAARDQVVAALSAQAPGTLLTVLHNEAPAAKLVHALVGVYGPEVSFQTFFVSDRLHRYSPAAAISILTERLVKYKGESTKGNSEKFRVVFCDLCSVTKHDSHAKYVRDTTNWLTLLKDLKRNAELGDLRICVLLPKALPKPDDSCEVIDLL